MWAPQAGPQLEAILATWCETIFYGGARGGGKSDFLLGDFVQDVPKYGSDWKGIVFRKTYKNLEELIDRAKQIYLPHATWYSGDKLFKWANGSTFKFRHLETESDAEEYQGHAYTWIGFDELPLWDNLNAFNKLKACLRSGANVPKRIRATGNPGGAAHNEVKALFVDPNPLGFKLLTNEFGRERMFIPSKLKDNPILLKYDPGYADRLREVGSAQLVKAWLDGDWNVIEGSYFGEDFSEKNIIAPFSIPAHWTRFRHYDFGSSRPFCCLWTAVSDGSINPYRNGDLITYREWYGCSKPNVGIKLLSPEIATGILARENDDEEITYSVADPAIFSREDGPSIAEKMHNAGVTFRPADNARVVGWQNMRQYMRGYDDKPQWYTFSTNVHLIRTLPSLQHDQRRPEDLDSNGEDHAADTLRYGIQSRPFSTELQKVQPIEAITSYSFAEFLNKKDLDKEEF